MSNFAKLTPIDMGENRNVFSAGKSEGANVKGASLSELFTAAASNSAGSPKYGVYFEMPERDDKYLLIVRNVDATTADPAHTAAALDVTIKGGNDKVFGGNDLVLADLDPDDYTFIKIDSGRFKNVAENATLATLANVTSVKGCVVVEAENAKLEFALIKMPF